MQLTEKEFLDMDEAAVLRAVLFEYSINPKHRFENAEKAMRLIANCSLQLMNNCKAGKGFLGRERWRRIELGAPTDMYSLWEDALKKRFIGKK